MNVDPPVHEAPRGRGWLAPRAGERTRVNDATGADERGALDRRVSSRESKSGVLSDSGQINPAQRNVHAYAEPPGSNVAAPLVLIFFSAGLVVLTQSIGSSVALLCVCCLTLTLHAILLLVSIRRNGDISALILAPVFLSTFQNVYLAPFSANISPEYIQVVLTLNVPMVVLTYFILALRMPHGRFPAVRSGVRSMTLILGSLLIYAVMTTAFSDAGISAAIASLRNFSAPILFVLVGLLAGPFVSFDRILKLLLGLGVAALVFGIVEWTTPDFWKMLSLHDLWNAKGIPVTPGSLLPKNFYASEQLVPGEFIRRMAGPFADPVNFGTFVFCIIAVSWYRKSRLVLAWSIATAVVTVSKGSLLGILTLVSVFCYKFRSRFEFTFALLVTGACAYYFYDFTERSSTGSTTVHIDGLLDAIRLLPLHPFGQGLGSTGVLAGILSDNTEVSSQIVESGLGMILGQLGLVGFVLYIAFFFVLVRLIRGVSDRRMFALAMSLLLGLGLNAMFNEVALSPNSCGAYMLVIGVVIAQRTAGARVSRAYQSKLESRF